MGAGQGPPGLVDDLLHGPTRVERASSPSRTSRRAYSTSARQQTLAPAKAAMKSWIGLTSRGGMTALFGIVSEDLSAEDSKSPISRRRFPRQRLLPGVRGSASYHALGLQRNRDMAHPFRSATSPAARQFAR